MPTLIDKRENFSLQRVEELKNGIKNISVLKDPNDICIYITGSYGRLEASPNSDADIFFLEKDSKLSRIDKILLDADLINITRNLNFPEFSNDGQFLQIHNLNEILEKLGCPEDDYSNFFTARMLLILESLPLNNEKTYYERLKEVINTYFRDYHDHYKDFKPYFLTNDIIRYYKTLCLNYENKRNRKEKDQRTKNKAHLKNLKLKFSRLLTCYATIIAIAKRGNSPEKLLEIVKQKPVNRIIDTVNADDPNLNHLLDLYSWFLEITNKPEEDMLEWIGDRNNRDLAFDNGREFHKFMYLILETYSKDDLMYLTL